MGLPYSASTIDNLNEIVHMLWKKFRNSLIEYDFQKGLIVQGCYY
jgi:hypothetical protein